MVKKILYIDAGKDSVRDCLKSLKELEPEIKTNFCESVEEGRKFFGSDYYGLIIIDLSILNKGILEFIEEIRRGNFFGDIIFTGNYKNESIMEKIRLLKDIEILLKPIDEKWFIEQLKKYFSQNISIGNRITSIGPLFFMKLLNFGDCTITCKITKNGKTGFINFEKGEIINAKSWKNTEELAIIDLISLNDAQIELVQNKIFIPKKIETDFNSLINKCIKRISDINVKEDENKKNKESDFIKFMKREIDKIKGERGDKIVDSSIVSMGLDINDFPSEYEIDLIEHVSGEIKDKSKLLIFKKNMISFLRDQENKKIITTEN